MSAPLLEVRKLTLRFGGLVAVNAVDLQVQQGEIAAVIGPNGAGKTSLFNAITGIYEPTSGEVLLNGRDVRAPLTSRVYAQWFAAGLLMAGLALVSIANVDGLWAATVKTRAPWEFTLTGAAVDGWRYLNAEPRVEPKFGKFAVVSFDGLHIRGQHALRADAERQRGELASQPGDSATVRALTMRLIAALVGLVVGTLGARAMWYRNRRSPQSVALQGVARTFQNIRLFHHMTVLENVLVGMDRHLHLGTIGRGATANSAMASSVPRRGALDYALPLAAVVALSGLGWFTGDGVDDEGAPTALLAVFVVAALAWMVRVFRNKALSSAGRVVEAVARQEALELLRFVGLEARAGDLAKNLPYGEQRRLEIARALATRPSLLLLDEPAAGMNPAESVELMHLIRKIRDGGRTVLLIEHHMRVVMGISDHITVLVHGTPIAHGTPEQIRSNPKVIEAYLGTEDAEAHG